MRGSLRSQPLSIKGSGKRFVVRLAEQLDIPTEEIKYDKSGELCGERALTMDQLRDEIAENVGPVSNVN